jgi:mRNA-degrading endonuclease RelE of RelBE toxin-antitoxin system
MSHQPLFSPAAEKDLARLPEAFQKHVLAEIERLAANPVLLSRPSVPPWLPNRQMFRADPLEVEDGRHEFHVFFRYGQDEETIHVLAIGHYRLG